MENNADRNLLLIIMTRYVSRIFFNKDRFQAIHWLQTSNINFKGDKPKDLIMNGNADKVWNFLESRMYDLGQTD